jgi:hypothetical protein
VIGTKKAQFRKIHTLSQCFKCGGVFAIAQRTHETAVDKFIILLVCKGRSKSIHFSLEAQFRKGVNPLEFERVVDVLHGGKACKGVWAVEHGVILDALCQHFVYIVAEEAAQFQNGRSVLQWQVMLEDDMQND